MRATNVSKEKKVAVAFTKLIILLETRGLSQTIACAYSRGKNVISKISDNNGEAHEREAREKKKKSILALEEI